MCFFSCAHVIIQTQDIMTGILVGNDAKETSIQKEAEKRNPYKKAAWKSTRSGEKKKDPEDVALQNDTQKCNTFEITISYKKVIGWDTTFISWRKWSPYKIMTDLNAGARNYVFCKG